MILELSKEKTNERLLDRQAAAFTASVQHVEAELSAQIRYLTQVCVVERATLPPQLSASALFFKSPGHSFGPPEPSKTSPTQQARRSWQHPSLPGQVSCVTELHYMSQWVGKPWERASKQ